MNIIIQSTIHPKKIANICRIGIKNHIFKSYGMMQYWMTEPSKLKAISIAYNGNKPIGIAIIRKTKCTESYVNIAIYIKTAYRRKGIGLKLLRRIKYRLPGKNIIAWKDSAIANKLYSKLRI